MYLQNSLYSSIEQYSTNKIKEQKNNKITVDYKSYDKKQDNKFLFICYNINSSLVTKSNILLKKVTMKVI